MKKFLMFFVVFVLVVCTLVPIALAAPVPNSGIPYYAVAWNAARDSQGYVKVLQGHGMQVVMTVGNANDNNSIWYSRSAPHGGSYLQNLTSPYELVNMTRVLQYGTYYNCRGYSYDSATSGRDQRLAYSGAYAYLANPIVTGTWYLQTDKSSISSVSDVIFYTGTGTKAQWQFWDSRYN